MKISMGGMGLLVAACMGFSGAAFAQVSSGIEIGTGAEAQSGGEVAAVFRLDGRIDVKNGQDMPTFLVVRLNGDLAASSLDQVSVLDVHVEGLGMTLGNSDGYSELSFLNVDLQRNLALGEMGSYRLTFIGLRTGYAADISDHVKFIVDMAGDFAGLALSERAGDLTQVHSAAGMAGGYRVEAGVELNKTYRLAFTHKGGFNFGGAEYVDYSQPVYTCTGSDPYGYNGGYYNPNCWSQGGYVMHQQVSQYDTGVLLMAGLGKHLTAFGQVDYLVFKMSDDQGNFSSSRSSGWQLRFGFSYKPR